MKYIIIFILIWFFVQQTNAQQTGNISGKLLNKEHYNIAVLLKKSKDSMLVKAEMSADDKFIFYNIPYGQYFVEGVYLNRAVFNSGVFALDKNQLELQPISVSTPELKEIKIVSQKNIIEHKADKIIYNVENTLESPANDALAVMQKAPGISVDQNGNISMRGKKGVMVMINGKMIYLTGNQLSNFLKTTTAAQISKIEVISNPSSKYDAEGNAGIVNIILKKDQRQGVNGMVVLSYGRGKYRKSANGANINWKSKKVNIFASYNNSNNIGFNDLRLNRKFYTNQIYEGAYRQYNYLLFPSMSHLGKVAVDYDINSTSSLSFIANGNLTSFGPKGNNKSYVENNKGEDVSYYTSESKADEAWNNCSFSLNFKKILDSTGSELTADMDYAAYANTSAQNFVTKFFTMQHAEYKPAYLLTGDVHGRLNIKAFKADYVKPFKNRIKLESGVKTSFVNADNNLAYYDESQNLHVFDSAQSNHFIYSENINALYTSLSYEKNNFGIQAGLRAEQTIAKGNQLLNGNTFSRNYWQLFPTLFISKHVNEKNDFSFSFSRRIQRPGYDLMNPIKLFIDATTFKEGNPYLVPQNSYLFELSHTYKQQFISTLSAMMINKSITEVLIPAEGQSNITIQTNKNINRQYLYSYNFSAPVKLFKWWSTSNETTVYYSRYIGQLANMPINSGTCSFNAKTIHMLTLPKSFSLQIDAFIQYAENYTFSKLSPFGACNISVQKSFNQKRTSVKLTANDIFYTSKFRGSSSYTNYHEDFFVQRDSRTIVVALTHKYGKNSVPGMKRRATGADEEKQRAGKNA